MALIPALGLAAVLAVPVSTVALAHIPGSWTYIPALPDDATVSTVVGGNDGLLYVFGVCNDFCIQTNGIVHAGAPVTYAWDQADQIWLSGRGAPAICAGAKAAAVGRDGRIRLAGCWTNMLTDPGFRFAVFDPSTNRWILRTGNGPYVDPIVGLTNRDGQILWYSETLRNNGSAVFVSGHRIVQLVAGTWLRWAREPAAGPSDGAAVGADGRVYVAGGSRNCFPQFGTCPVPKVAAWSPASNSWGQPTSLPTPRIRVAVTADNQGRIFVIGGMAADGSGLFQTVDVYQPATGAWLGTRRLPAARFAAVATSTHDGRVYVFGGYDSAGNPLEDGYTFTPR